MRLDQHNNFDLIRLVAALLVVYSHSFALVGLPEPFLISPSNAFEGITFGTLGVSLFFFISGFLITQSRQTSGFLAFIYKRILRLYPALLVNMLVVYLIILPIAAPDAVRDYYITVFNNAWNIFSYGLAFQYLNFTGVLAHNFIRHEIQLSLWTLLYEVLCYAVILVSGINAKMKRNILLLVGTYLVWNWHDFLFSQKINILAIMHCAAFIIGAYTYLYRNYLRWNYPLALLSVVILGALSACDIASVPLYLLCVGYLIFFMAIRVRPLLNLKKYGDYSYGVYIYAFPIQQVLLSRFMGLSEHVYYYMCIALLLTTLCAILSWHCVEKPALQLKHRYFSQ